MAQTGRLEEAIDHYLQAIRLKPDYSDAYVNLGAALIQAGRLEEAISSYMQAVKIKPDYFLAYYNLAIVHAQLSQADQAMAMAQKAIEIARSRGQTEAARQIEVWLNSYRASHSDRQNTPSSRDPGSPAPY